MKTFTILAAALVATLGASSTLAQDAAPTRSVAVSYADLDLRSEAGRDALDSRIRSAIREVCGVASSSDLRGQNRIDACHDELAAQVAAQRDTALASARRSGLTIAVRR